MNTSYVIWDEQKAATNRKKHGVDFLEAATVLRDPLAITFEDRGYGEERFVAIGHSTRQSLLVVVFCYRNEGEIRIISARKATKRERAMYEKGI